jgi:2,3-bisphosphoglycerate-dependent phosphoglycerate mutase
VGATLGTDVRNQPDRDVNEPALPPLYLVRHCQATGQAPDAPLTAAGEAQAVALADLLAPLGIERIIASPYRCARDSAAPLAARLGIPIESDGRLIERVLSLSPLPDWRAHLAMSFDDPDYHLPGGESSRAATTRGLAAIHDACTLPARTAAIVTHGNLLALLLRQFDARVGFTAWAGLSNPDVYCVGMEKPNQPFTRLWTLSK